MMYHIIVFHSSFSRIRSEELNDMGYGLSRISPITFDNENAFQTPNNRTQGRVLMSTPRKHSKKTLVHEWINKTRMYRSVLNLTSLILHLETQVDLYHLVIASQIQRMQVIKQCFQVIPKKISEHWC